MSDYLNTIVARTLGLAPVVQPRLSSLFEPRSFAAVNAGLPSFEGDAASVDQSPRNPASEVSVRTLISEDDKQQGALTGKRKRRGIDRAVSNEDKGEAQEQPLDTIIRRSPVTPAAPLINLRMEPLPLGSEPGPDSPRRLRAQTHDEQKADSVSFAEGEAINLENSPRRGLRPRHKDAGHFDQSRALGTNPSERAEPDHPHTTNKFRGAIPVLQPNSLPVIPLRRAFAEQALDREVPPTISVTIGRVDVRAVFAPAPAARVSRAKQPSAMSLDDYLKKKNEGHR